MTVTERYEDQSEQLHQWIKRCEETDVVLFLGAGFSRHARLPTMADFGMASQDELAELSKHNCDDIHKFRNAVPDLLGAGKTYQDFQKFCIKGQSRVSIQANNMEDVYCLAEAIANAGFDWMPLGSEDERPLDEILMDIRLWLWKVYQCLPLVDRDELRAPYASLLIALETMQSPVVLTTNYDIVFEYMAWHYTKTPCAYPIAFTPLTLLEGAPSYLGAIDDEKSILMAKLHGSVNYFDDPEVDRPGLVHVAQDVLTEGKMIGNSSWDEAKSGYRDRPAILAIDSIWKIQKDNPKLQPAIVPPTYEKLRRQTWLRESWHAAVGAMRNAKGIIFIGYGMPATDGFMRSMIQAAMMLRDRPPPLVWIVDPNGDSVERYAKLFRGSKVTSVPFTFEEAAINGEIEKALEAISSAL
jgi:hypothetical protein